MIEKIRKYLCKCDPIDITGCVMIVLILGSVMAMVGWKTVGMLAIAIGFCVLGGLLAFGIFKATRYLQSKCDD